MLEKTTPNHAHFSPTKRCICSRREIKPSKEPLCFSPRGDRLELEQKAKLNFYQAPNDPDFVQILEQHLRVCSLLLVLWFKAELRVSSTHRTTEKLCLLYPAQPGWEVKARQGFIGCLDFPFWAYRT